MSLRTPEQLDIALAHANALRYFAEGPDSIRQHELGGLAVCYSVVHLPETKQPFPMAATIGMGNAVTEGRPIAILTDDIPAEFHGLWALSEVFSSQLLGFGAKTPRLLAETAMLRLTIRSDCSHSTKYAEARVGYFRNMANFLQKANASSQQVKDCDEAARAHSRYLDNVRSI